MNVTREVFGYYGKVVWRYPRYAIGLFTTIPLTILVQSFLPPLLLAKVLNRLSKNDFQPHHIWASFGTSLVMYAVLIIAGGLSWRIVDYFAWRLEGNVERDLADQVFQHLLRQSSNFHANRFGGTLVSQNNKLLNSFVRISDTTLFQVIPLFSSLLWASLILASKAPLFTLLLLGFSFFYIVSAFFVTRKVRDLGSKHAEAESAQTGYLADTMTNVMAVKSFARGKFETEQYGKATETTRSRLLALGRGQQRQHLYFGTLANLISASSLLMAVVGIMELHANLATVFLILSYTSNVVGQLFTFSNNSLRNYNRSIGDTSEMVQVLNISPEVKDPEHPEKSRIHDGAISFKNVVFTHDGSDDALFYGLNLDVKPGEKIGLVGHSGSGKTTLAKLLLRFSDIDGGTISIDGQDISHITQDDLRSHIAYVPQEPLLFHRSIEQNIAYGNPKASHGQIIDAAIKSYAAEFIKQLPQGYETLVGERGVKLSGGQRQRIAIARAILKDAPILLLDEATSSLDSESEQLIQAALKKLMEKRTAIIVAHRLSTIQKMDRIIVLDDGKIVEQGSHAQLLDKKGVYAKLWAHQSGGFLESD